MKNAAYLWLFLFFPVFLTAQGFLKTIVPTNPIMAGDAFRVQYIVEDGSKVNQFITPDFYPLKLITGPAIYLGENTAKTGFKQSKNYVFTIVASSSGKFRIPAAVIILDGQKVKGSDSFVEVKLKSNATVGIKEASSYSDYSLRPDENAMEKIRKNLFIKAFVDKRNCYTGEPVLVTYKLYSRLESASEIVKNPGFYGFTVYDMVNLQDKQANLETVNGESFNVHTIRKVQLFPLQPGRFFIDAMEVKNKVTFSGSNKINKTDKAIPERLFDGNENAFTEEESEVYEINLKTVPVEINVKPITEKNKPITFNGAVGSFAISSTVIKNVQAKSEEGLLEIIIRGKGNFLQLGSPVVLWPKGFEVFEPSVKDTFDKAKMPVEGSRVFRYAFVSSNTGKFSIPAINFSFFNPDSGKYKTVATNAIQLNITELEKSKAGISLLNNSANSNNATYYWILSGVLLLAGFSTYWYVKRKNKSLLKEVSLKNEERPKLIIDDLMAPSYLQLDAGGKLYYTSLYNAIWNFFNFHYNLSGSEMNKENLLITMKKKGVDKNDIEYIRSVLEECETGMFTSVNILKDRNKSLDTVQEILKRINPSLL